MNIRLLVVIMLFLLGGLSALLALQWRLQKKLGTADGSPQEVTVPLGTRVLIAGGRAGIELTSRRDDQAKLIVRCGEITRWLALGTGDTSDMICGVRLHLTGFTSATGTLATSRAHLVVSWGGREETSEEPTT